MRIQRAVAIALVALAPLTAAFAQNQLPTTNVRPAKPRIVAPTRIAPTPPIGSPDSHISAADAQKHFTYDPSVHYQSPQQVKPGDWNAPGVLDLSRMTEAEFHAFQWAHPTAVFWGRCYMGQDPDISIRHVMRRIQVGISCKG